MKERKPPEARQNTEPQVIEGRIDNIEAFESGGWEQTLPSDLKLEDVDLYLKTEGGTSLWHWHLKPGLIKDERIREAWEREREIWS